MQRHLHYGDVQRAYHAEATTLMKRPRSNGPECISYEKSDSRANCKNSIYLNRMALNLQVGIVTVPKPKMAKLQSVGKGWLDDKL